MNRNERLPLSSGPATTGKRARLLYSAFVLAILYFLYNARDWLVRISIYRYLYRNHPYYVPEGI